MSTSAPLGEPHWPCVLTVQAKFETRAPELEGMPFAIFLRFNSIRSYLQHRRDFRYSTRFSLPKNESSQIKFTRLFERHQESTVIRS